MPIYGFKCVGCGEESDHVVKYEDRNKLIRCEGCYCKLVRDGVSAPNIGSPTFQMQAVMGNGSHVKGHFGKAAKKKHKVQGKRR